MDPAPPLQDQITLIAKKVLGEQLHQTRKEEQAATNRIHDADHQKAALTHGIVQVMHGEADCLADGGGGAVGEGHEPGFGGGGPEGGDACDAGA